MPQYTSPDDTEEARYRKLAQNLYEAAGVAWPFTGGTVPWNQYIRGVLTLWDINAFGTEEEVLKRLAMGISQEYGLGISFSPFWPHSQYLREVAIVASGDCLCVDGGIFESLGVLVNWSSTLS